MSDFINIYVDLERTTDADGIIDAQGFVQCNTQSPAGTVTNPLNLEQFRTYLKFEHRGYQNFFLKGKTIIDITDGTNSYLTDDVLFETPHTGSILKITNWVVDTDPIDEPWTIVVSAAAGGDIGDLCNIVTNNDSVEIMNGEIEITEAYSRLQFGTSYNGFTDDLNNDNNTLAIVNTKLYTEEATDLALNYHPLAFRNYKKLTVVGSIISNKSFFGSIIVENKFTDDMECYFINNIFYNIKYMVGFPVDDNISRVDARVKQSSFTSSLTTFSTTNIPSNVYNIFNVYDMTEVNNVQFAWGGASACEESFVDLSQLENFNYLDEEGWLDISISGVKNTYNVDGIVKKEYAVPPLTTFTRWRDGIGALTFNTMQNPMLSATVSGTSATMVEISGTAYDTLYAPSYYQWVFGEDNTNGVEITSATSVASVFHEYNSPGNYNVGVEVFSHNEWYSVDGNVQVNVFFTSADYDIYLVKISATCFDDEIYSQPLDGDGILSAYTFDEILLSAVNTSPYESNQEIFNKWGGDFNESTKILYQYFWRDNDNGDFPYPGGKYIDTYRYMTSGYYHVYFGTELVDGMVSASWKPINVHSRPENNYYVDLDEYYETSGGKWIYKKTGIYDTFESGSLDTSWGTTFKSVYSVVDMWENKCASNGMSNLFARPMYYNFDLEWEFVRTSKDNVPYVLIKSLANDVLKFEWDYDNDVINVYYYGIKYSIKYKLSDMGLVKDLRCPNSLRFLPIRVKHEPYGEGSGVIEIYVKFGDVWKNYNGLLYSADEISEDDKRLLVEVSTDATTGFGYIKMQSQCGLPYNNGSQTYPLTYAEFKRMTTIEDNGKYGVGMPTADYVSNFYCKNYRKITEPYKILNYKYFKIDSWDMDVYGPWMIIVDIHFNNPIKGTDYVVSFTNAKLSNGILYNIKEETSNGRYVPNLEITQTYDMIIVWNSKDDDNNYYHGYIRIVTNRLPNRKTISHFADYIGTTIKSERGFIMYVEDDS